MGWTAIHLRLLYFYSYGILYWGLRLQSPEKENLESVIAKCLPIAGLILFALDTEPRPNQGKIYLSTILGLSLCCIADAFLVYEDLFIWGMLTFALGHVAYQIGFGWERLKAWIGVVLAVIIGVILYFIVPHITDSLVMYLTPVYALLLGSNVWRSLAWGTKPLDYLCGAGFILFSISDTLLIVNRYVINLNHGQVGVMVTYYLAQYLIAVGVFAGQDLPNKISIN